MKKILFILLLLSSTCFGTTAIDTTHWETRANNQVKPLGMPRQKVMLSENDSGKIFLEDYNVRRRISVSYNLDSSTIFPYTFNFGDNAYDFSDHSHWNILDDTLYMAGLSGSYIHLMKMYENGGFTIATRDSTVLENANASFAVASIVRLPDSDTIFAIARQSGGDITDGKVFISTDAGTNWNAGDTLRYTLNTSDIRIGLLANSQTAYIYCDSNANGLISVFKFNRTTQSWVSDGDGVVNGGNRAGGITIYDDTILFVGACNDPFDDSIYFYSAFKHVDSPSTAWNTIDPVTISAGVGAGTTPSLFGASLTFIESSKRTVACIGGYSSDSINIDSVGIFAVVFDWADSTWGSKAKVNTGYDIMDGGWTHSSHYITPSVWGDQMFVYYNANAGAGVRAQLTQLTFDDLITIDGFTYPYKDTITSTPVTLNQDSTAYVILDTLTGTMVNNGFIYVSGCDYCALTSNSGKQTILSTGIGDTSPEAIRIVNSPFFRIDNIRFDVGWGNDSSIALADLPVHVRVTSGRRLKVTNTYARMAGFCTYGTTESMSNFSVGGGQEFYMIDFEDDSLIMDGTGYDLRAYDPQVALRANHGTAIDSITTGSRSDYSLRVANSYVESNFIGLYGGAGSETGSDLYDGVVVFDSNTIKMKYRNTSATTLYAHGDGGAIKMNGLDKFFIRGNTITHDTSSTVTPEIYGGSGIFIASMRNTDLTSGDTSEIVGNTITTGLNRNTDHSYGIFQKFAGLLLPVKIDSNIFNTVDYPNSRRPSDGQGGFNECIWMMRCQFASFYDNTFNVLNDDNSSQGYAIIIRNNDSANNQEFQFNYDSIFTSDNGIKFYSDSDGTNDGVNNITFTDIYIGRNDSVTTTVSNSLYDHDNANGRRVADINFIDIKTGGGVTDTTAVTWATTNNTDYVDFWRNLQIIVEDEFSNPLNGSVVIITAYGDTIYNTTVGTDGADTLLTKYWHNTAGSADSSYNQFIGTVVYSTDTVIDTFSVGEANYIQIFTFSGGTPPSKQIQFRGNILQGVR